jgi:Cu(I)/Ag(I) efflux system membrane fusion protein
VTLVPAPLEVVVNIDEGSVGQVAEGQAVQLQVASFPGQSFAGTVKSIAPALDTRTRTTPVQIEPVDPDGKLRAGMFAQLSIVTAEKADALTVPTSAVVASTPDTPAVLTIDSTGRVHRQAVRLGLRNADSDEVLSGVDAGQLIATSSTDDLADGDIVSPQIRSS